MSQGKYLGVYLGVGGREKTFAACEDKYLSRCFDISLNAASALPSIVRYNQVAVPVFSYVSQVLLHPDIPRLKGLDQRGVHKAFKLPPNCMNQALSHSFGNFCPISPKPIYSLCIAAHSRFAKAENLALCKIHDEAIAVLGNNASLASFATSSLASAFIGDRPLIECLLDSLKNRGVYLQFAPQLHAAVLSRGRSPTWSQAWFYNIYARSECTDNIQFEVESKILKTFEEDIAYHLTIPGDWFRALIPLLTICKPYVAMCLFKTYVGAWTTSSRMHETVVRTCLLGCSECQDNINHYMQCSPLWQIASNALGVSDPFNMSMRLCLVSPTAGNAQLLAMVYSLYHSAHASFKGSDRVSPTPRTVQRNLVEAAKVFRHHFNGLR